MFHRSMGIAAIALISCTWAAAQLPSFDAASGFRYNSNLSNAEDSADVRDDFFWKFAAALSWNKPAGRDWRLAARVFAGTEVPFQYSAFTMAKTGVDLRATRKFGLGVAAPSASAAVSFERDFFQDPQMSMWLLVPSVKWTQKFGEAWSIEGIYRLDARFAESELFSGLGNEGALLIRWEPAGRWSFSAGYRLRYGDVVSFSTPPQPAIKSVSTVVEPGNTIFGQPLTAYRLAALTQSFSAGAAFALTPDLSLELTGEFQHISRSAITYNAYLAQVSAKVAF